MVFRPAPFTLAMGRMSTLRRSESFVSRKVGDDIILVPVRAGVANLEAVFTMNAVGSAIWNRIDGTATVDDLELAQRHLVPLPSAI